MVDNDGKNRYPEDENWLTDGYGDYVRHYLRAMAAAPELAPSDEEHILSSTSVIQQADYKNSINKFLVPYVKNVPLSKVTLYYRTYDDTGKEVIYLLHQPSKVLMNEEEVTEVKDVSLQGYTWQPKGAGGFLTIYRKNAKHIIVVQ